ncbi:30S ribosomal protein S6 [Intestinimonas sp. UBA1698]|uniref:30S ribosomal protein S6 n=1 Tax=Intestinimonas sp. UBA1698 TaxID=1946651 RepID=UPI00257B8A54|nr:30S ribosomal protein S6 [Intestinimonas sp. UBA1698]
MAKVNGNYEVVYILDPAMSDEATAALVAKFKTMAEAHGTVKEVDEWGKRRLAYPINDLNEGYYVLMSFDSDAAFPNELARVLRITDGVMRSQVVCLDE